MIKDLVKIAAELDELGLTKDADLLDSMISKLAQDLTDEEEFLSEDTARRVAQQIQDGKVALKDAIVDLVESGLSIDHVRSLALDTLAEFED